jgi:putative oxygen-independent coproporphyrinogen III oxidase
VTTDPFTDEAFGVYVHWPFCAARCPYCDFNAHVRQTVDQAAYARALAREAAHMAAVTGPRRVSSVFFGGGTPSLMEVATVEAVLGAIADHWTLADDAEITLEANPTSAEAARFRGYRAAGVNRLSLGVQALDDVSLKALGRLHGAKEAMAALTLARDVFERVSFDLISARPGQSEDQWADELRRALALGPDHLSVYQLTIEKGTPFAALHERGALTLPDENAAAAMQEATEALCTEAGLHAYEVSNHARPGAESRHNLTYWRYHDYAGIGPGAHGRLTPQGAQRGGGEKIATATLKPPEAWLAAVDRHGHGIEDSQAVPRATQAEEMVMMGLRLREGIDLERWRALRGGMLPDGAIDDLCAEGLLERGGGRLRATPRGRLLLNAVLAWLLS